MNCTGGNCYYDQLQVLNHVAPCELRPAMTVDELLLKLDAEYEKLNSGKPNHFLKIGERFKRYGADYWETRDAVRYLDEDIARQKEILDLKATIKEEVER